MEWLEGMGPLELYLFHSFECVEDGFVVISFRHGSVDMDVPLFRCLKRTTNSPNH